MATEIDSGNEVRRAAPNDVHQVPHHAIAGAGGQLNLVKETA